MYHSVFLLIISQESITYNEKKTGDSGSDGIDNGSNGPTDTMGVFHETKIKLLSLILITFSVSQRTIDNN